MRILIDIGHPGHVHLFKNFAWEMQKEGHEILFTCREKEFEIYLLNHYGFNFKSFGKKYNSSIGKFWGLIKFDILEFIQGLRFKPDIFLSHGSMYAAQASYLLRKPHISFEDTGNMEQINLYKPFSKVIISTNAINADYGNDKVVHLKYEGFHQNAYLIEPYFKPDKAIFKLLKIQENTKFAILRFVATNATHDKDLEMLSFEQRYSIVKEINKYMKVFISSEEKMEDEFAEYKLEIPPEKIHDAIYYSNLMLSQSGAMTNESSFLGIPTIIFESRIFDVTRKFVDLNLRYHYYRYSEDFEVFFEKMLRDISVVKEEKTNLCIEYKKNSIDLTKYLIWFVNNYPNSRNLNYHKNTEWEKYVK